MYLAWAEADRNEILNDRKCYFWDNEAESKTQIEITDNNITQTKQEVLGVTNTKFYFNSGILSMSPKYVLF